MRVAVAGSRDRSSHVPDWKRVHVLSLITILPLVECAPCSVNLWFVNCSQSAVVGGVGASGGAAVNRFPDRVVTSPLDLPADP